MKNEELQYQVTFKTRAEGDGAQKTADEVKALREETEALNTAQAEGAAEAGGAAGVEEVTTAIQEQAESVEILQQRQDDVAEAQRLASERRLDDLTAEARAEIEAAEAARASAAARLAAGAAIAAVAKRSIELVAQTIEQYRAIAPEAAEDFSTVALAIQTLQDPIGTLIEGITGTQAELTALAASRAEAHRQEQLYLAAVARKQEEIRVANEAFVDGPLARRLQTIRDETAEYERQKKEVQAVTRAMEAQANMADAIALSNKDADPNQIAAGRIRRETAAKSADSDATVGDAQKRWEDAIKVAEAATSAYAQAKALNNETAGKEAKMNAAIHARDEAKKDLDSVLIQEEAAKAEIAAGAVQALVGVKDQALGDLTTAANETMVALQAEAAEQSAALAASGRKAMGDAGELVAAGMKQDAAEQALALGEPAQEALKLLTAAFQDKVITPDEVASVKQALEQLKGSREKFDSAVRDGMQKMIGNIDLLISNQKELDERIHAQKQRIEGVLRGR